MILAAGRGERLRPITDTCPKALCPIQGSALLEHHINNLKRAGIEKIVINHAYLGGKIRQTIGNGERWGINIHYMPEPPGGLETGGGIYNALPYLGTEPFITVNADIFTNYDFQHLQLPFNKAVHLVLVKPPSHSKEADFGLSAQLLVENQPRQYTFSGIACYDPNIFHNCSPGRYSVTPILRQLIKEKKVSGEVLQGEWYDIGSPERLEYVQALKAVSVPR